MPGARLRLRLLLAALCAAPAMTARAWRDVVLRPPAQETFVSPNGRYVLDLRLREQANQHAARSTATLYETAAGSGTRTPVWRADLPHRPRPRFVLVADDGRVVLLDEWLNVRSALAVTVIGPDGRTLARHDLEAVRSALAVPAGALAPLARHGVWIQAPPVLGARGDSCEVQAGGRTLSIALHDGTLSAR